MRKLLAVILAAAMIFGMITTSFAAVEEPTASISSTTLKRTHTYADVKGHEWFSNAVGNLTQLGITLGEDTASFGANEPVSRKDAASALYQLHGEETPPVDKVFNHASMGGNDGASDSEASVTLEQLAVVMYGYASDNGMNTSYNTYLQNYYDGDMVSEHAVTAMNWAISSGCIQGNSQVRLNPGEMITRGQLAVCLDRYIRNALTSADNNYSDNYGIMFEYPSDSQATTAQGRDFYIIGDFIGNVKIPDDAHVEVTVTSNSTGEIMRTIYSDKKDDYNSLNVDYKYLNVWSDGGDREKFRYSGMPDLVYDANNPASFNNTWIKCFYTDERFAATVFGGEYTRDVNTVDQYGKTLDVLPDGTYTIAVTVTAQGQSNPIAYAKKEMNVGTYPDKITSPFQPDEHFDNLKKMCAEIGYEIFIDPFPGYWNWPFINPDWGGNHYGTITAKWRYMDATEYNTGNIHFYVYDIGVHSTAYELEIGQVESRDKNLDRVTTYYYDIGEPSIGKDTGSLFKMDTTKSPVVFTRAERLTPETTLGDGHMDMRTLGTVDFTRLASRDNIVCSGGDVIALYGACAPVMSVGDIEMNPETSNYSLNNRIETIRYTVGDYVYEKKVELFRDHATTNLESGESGFEFKHDFTIPANWKGRTCKVTYTALDSFGNVVAKDIPGPSLYVLG